MWEARERRVRLHRRLRGLPPDPAGFDGRQAFELARRLAAGGVWFSHALYDGPLGEAFARLGLDPEPVMAGLWAAFDAVRTDRSTDGLAVAMGRADGYAARFRHPGRERHYPRVAALAYCLSLDRPRAAHFPLPVERVAGWLGVERRAAGRVVRALDADGVIRLRRDEGGRVAWSYRAGDAREAVYTGPRFPADG